MRSVEKELPAVFIVSKVQVQKGSAGGFKGEEVDGLFVTVEKADGEKCERCWTYEESVGSDSEHPTLCARCAAILKAE